MLVKSTPWVNFTIILQVYLVAKFFCLPKGYNPNCNKCKAAKKHFQTKKAARKMLVKSTPFLSTASDPLNMSSRSVIIQLFCYYFQNFMKKLFFYLGLQVYVCKVIKGVFLGPYFEKLFGYKYFQLQKIDLGNFSNS